MRLASYMKQERSIIASDGDTIIQRWKWGRRLLCDDTAITANGNLKHGVLQRLVDKAKAEGLKLSVREIQYRLRAARMYETEAQIRRASADFDYWWALISAGFPPVEVPDPGDPYDPRWHDEKLRDSNRKFRRATLEMLRRAQNMFPGLDEFNTLGDYEKLLAERRELNARRVQEDAAAAIELEQLLTAVGGDRAATIADALEALESEFDDDEDVPET